MLKINGYQNNVAGLNELAQKTSIQSSKGSRSGQVDAAAKSFASELSSATAATRNDTDVKFSKHAMQRMHSRNVTLSQSQLERLSEAMDKAGAKGARETLVLTDDAAYVVAPDNRTVISAFDRSSLREGVFTKIDSAVIL